MCVYVGMCGERPKAQRLVLTVFIAACAWHVCLPKHLCPCLGLTSRDARTTPQPECEAWPVRLNKGRNFFLLPKTSNLHDVTPQGHLTSPPLLQPESPRDSPPSSSFILPLATQTLLRTASFRFFPSLRTSPNHLRWLYHLRCYIVILLPTATLGIRHSPRPFRPSLKANAS
jgi:hypothetical protein